MDILFFKSITFMGYNWPYSVNLTKVDPPFAFYESSHKVAFGIHTL
jgi:hypothetical protein